MKLFPHKPNIDILTDLGLKSGEKYLLLRFISWTASHDFGQAGFSSEIKLEIINKLESRYRIFISSEVALPPELEKYQLTVSPDRIHDILYFAELYIGEGATMASEAAILGTPAIYVNSIQAGTIDDQEKQGLLFHICSKEAVFDKIDELSAFEDVKAPFKMRREKMLLEKVDVTAFLVWFVENWPKSMKRKSGIP
ncbi:MAG: DUF354 domain-containing protein [Bacteroidota bacterium]